MSRQCSRLHWRPTDAERSLIEAIDAGRPLDEIRAVRPPSAGDYQRRKIRLAFPESIARCSRRRTRRRCRRAASTTSPYEPLRDRLSQSVRRKRRLVAEASIRSSPRRRPAAGRCGRVALSVGFEPLMTQAGPRTSKEMHVVDYRPADIPCRAGQRPGSESVSRETSQRISQRSRL